MIESPFIEEVLKYDLGTKPKSRISSSYVKRIQSYIGIPALSIPNTWRGASEIIHEFLYSPTTYLSFITRFPVTAPPDCNYCPCIAWKPTSDTIVRYKLWKDVGEILYVPVYSGQRFNIPFSIEIWNTNHATISGSEQFFYTSQTYIPTNRCLELDHNLGAPQDCTDVTLNLVGFNPLLGDYYLVVGNCGEADLIHGIIGTPENKIQSTDGSWHVISIDDSVVGDIRLNIHQDNTTAGVKGYFEIKMASYGNRTFKVDLEAIIDGGGTTHILRNSSEILSPLTPFNTISLPGVSGNYLYTLLRSGDINLNFVGQTTL